MIGWNRVLDSMGWMVFDLRRFRSVDVQAERMRAGLEEARRRHARALLVAAGRAASGRLRAAEAEAVRALRRNAELEEKARQAGAECQAWMGVAQSHEAVAAGLRGTLEQLLLRPPARTRPWARTRSRAASRRRPRTRRRAQRRRAGRAAAARRACCCSRAGTCACAARARPARTRAPSARRPRTPRSLSWSPDEAYGESVRPSVHMPKTQQARGLCTRARYCRSSAHAGTGSSS